MLPEIKTILYATDMSEKGSTQAFRMAVSQALCNAAQLVVLHAMEPLSASAEAMMRNTLSDREYETLREQGFEHQREELRKRIDEFCRAECPDPEQAHMAGDPVIVVEVGEPDEVILHAAKEYNAELIIMGTRTHTGIGQVLLGSVANKVIHHAKVPVMVYPL